MKNLLQTSLGLFRSPGKAIEGAMIKKRWLLPLIFLLILNAVFFQITYSLNQKQQAERLTDEQMEVLNRYGPMMQRLMLILVVIVILLSLIIGTFLVYLFYKIAGAEGLYVNYFSGFVFASLIDMGLGRTLGIASVLLLKSNVFNLNLTLLFPSMTRSNIFYYLLAMIDLFPIWFLIALALGIARYAKITVKNSFSCIGAYLFFKIIIIAPLSYIAYRIAPK